MRGVPDLSEEVDEDYLVTENIHWLRPLINLFLYIVAQYTALVPRTVLIQYRFYILNIDQATYFYVTCVMFKH